MAPLQKRGNIIKVDRHKYVKVAYHGFRQLTSEERNKCYNQSAVRDDFEEPNYAMIDTLFSLAEAYLFMQLVELVVGWSVLGVAGSCLRLCYVPVHRPWKRRGCFAVFGAHAVL